MSLELTESQKKILANAKKEIKKFQKKHEQDVKNGVVNKNKYRDDSRTNYYYANAPLSLVLDVPSLQIKNTKTDILARASIIKEKNPNYEKKEIVEEIVTRIILKGSAKREMKWHINNVPLKEICKGKNIPFSSVKAEANFQKENSNYLLPDAIIIAVKIFEMRRDLTYCGYDMIELTKGLKSNSKELYRAIYENLEVGLSNNKAIEKAVSESNLYPAEKERFAEAREYKAKLSETDENHIVYQNIFDIPLEDGEKLKPIKFNNHWTNYLFSNNGRVILVTVNTVNGKQGFLEINEPYEFERKFYLNIEGKPYRTTAQEMHEHVYGTKEQENILKK